MVNLAVGSVACILLILLWLKDYKLKKSSPNSKKIANYFALSEHRQFLMGVAAIMIVLFHGAYYNDIYIFDENAITLPGSSLIRAGLSFLYQNFDTGVEMFLLYSGIGLFFSFENKKVNFKQYYIKRILNIYVIKLIIDLPWVIYADLIFENKGILYALGEWTGLLNFTGKTRTGWYVIFAMILYALYPLIFKILKKLEKTKLDFYIIAAFCVAWALLCKGMEHFIPDIYATVEIAVTRIPVFIIGCYLGRFVYYRKQYSARLYAVCALGVVAWVFFNRVAPGLITKRLSHCLLALAVSVLLLPVADFLKSKVKCIYRLFVFFGGMSLEIYLIHAAFAKAIFLLNGVNSILLYLLLAALSVFISYFVAKLRKQIVKKYMDSVKAKALK